MKQGSTILDCMVDLVDEKDQTEFEKNILEAFELFIDNRFENLSTYKISKE